jgi:ubiquinone/menaquinone biosynthesis C-methylase UbiE
MGERALQIGTDDPSLVGAIAAKVGLSGHAAMAVPDSKGQTIAQRAGSATGALIDVRVAPLEALPFDSSAFDVIVLHAGTSTPVFESSTGSAMLRECYRVLRDGGRIVIIEGSPRSLFKGSSLNPSSKRAADSLGTAGFRIARILAEREGYRFTEGLK